MDQEIYITHNHDDGYIYFRCDKLGVNVEIPERNFTELTMIHLMTGKSMLKLVQDWDKIEEEE